MEFRILSVGVFIAALAVLNFSCVNGAPSDQCLLDIAAYQNGLLSANQWALKMLDSSSKLPSDGLLEGSFLYQLGNFDECLSVQGPLASDNKPRFTGKYCRVQLGFDITDNADLKSRLVYAQMKMAYQKISNRTVRKNFGEFGSPVPNSGLIPGVTIPAQWAVCAPSSCNAEGVKLVADFNLKQFFDIFSLTVDSAVIESSCHHDGDGRLTLDAGSWAFFITFLLLTSYMVVATILDILWPKGAAHIAVQAFSLKTNLRNLFTLPEGVVPGQLTCLHGIRVFSTLWIILEHTYLTSLSYPLTNFASASDKYLYEWSMAPIFNGSLAVDTFFFMSGLLTVYVVLLDQKKGRSFNVFKYILFRYLRITLPLAAVVFYLATLHMRVAATPLWDVIFEGKNNNCENYWWVNLLYFANFYKPYESSCLGQGWYLMVDMQLAVLAPLVIYPLLKWPKIGLGLIGVLTLGSMAVSFGLTIVYDLEWTLSFFVPPTTTGDFFKLIYGNPAARAVPYLCGMALAYVLANKITFKLPKWGVALEWILNSAGCLALIYTIMIVHNRDFVYDSLQSAFYSAFHRIGWSVGISWIIWACVNGYAGPVDSILSWKYFLPLSKLSFCAFLVHSDTMRSHIALTRTKVFYSTFEMVFEYFANLIMIMPVTFWLYLAVDAPCQTIIRAAFGKTNRFKAPQHEEKYGGENNTSVEDGKTEKLN